MAGLYQDGVYAPSAVLPAEDGRRRRPARRDGLEFVEKLLPNEAHQLTSTDTTKRNAGMLLTRNRHEPAY